MPAAVPLSPTAPTTQSRSAGSGAVCVAGWGSGAADGSCQAGFSAVFTVVQGLVGLGQGLVEGDLLARDPAGRNPRTGSLNTLGDFFSVAGIQMDADEFVSAHTEGGVARANVGRVANASLESAGEVANIGISCLASEFERLQSIARQTGQPLLLIAWDLDGLKQVNDQQGHLAGDAYIRNFASALQRSIRNPTDVRPGDAAFRVGGDEFISIHLDARDGEKIAERVQRSGSWVSAGWVPCEKITLDQALTQADQALYHSKDRRKNRPGSCRRPRLIPAGNPNHTNPALNSG